MNARRRKVALGVDRLEDDKGKKPNRSTAAINKRMSILKKKAETR